jgi:positive regulator of sigma E activity
VGSDSLGAGLTARGLLSPSVGSDSRGTGLRSFACAAFRYDLRKRKIVAPSPLSCLLRRKWSRSPPGSGVRILHLAHFCMAANFLGIGEREEAPIDANDSSCSIGTVIAIDDDLTTLRLATGGACSSCAASGACGVDLSGNTRAVEILVIPEDGMDLQINDVVEIETPPGAAYRVSALVFLLPTLCFIAGAALGPTLLGSALAGFTLDMSRDALGALGGFVALALSFLPAALYERARRDRIRRAYRLKRRGPAR